MDVIKEVTDEVTLIRESRHRSAQKFMRQSNSFSFGYFFKKLFSFKSKKKRKNVLQRKKLMITSKNLALVYGFPVNGKHVMPPLTDCVPTSEIVSKSSSEDDEEELCSELHSLEVSSCCSLAWKNEFATLHVHASQLLFERQLSTLKLQFFAAKLTVLLFWRIIFYTYSIYCTAQMYRLVTSEQIIMLPTIDHPQATKPIWKLHWKIFPTISIFGNVFSFYPLFPVSKLSGDGIAVLDWRCDQISIPKTFYSTCSGNRKIFE